MNKWNKLHWDSRDSENVDQAYPKYMADKYGEDSNVFRIRVMGDPPKDDERTFIPLDWAISCIDNQFEIDPYAPCYLGVDVARYGEDESIILPRKGLKIYPWSTFQGMNTIDLGGHALETLREFDADGMGVDEIGVGAGLVDWLQKLPGGLRKAHGVNVTRESSDKNRFHRLRDELWWEMREKCRKQMYWFPGDTAKERELSNELCNELSSLYYDFDNNGAYVVESKKMAKARGIKSPNIADALGISEYFYNSAYQLFLKSNDKGIRKPRPWETQNVVTVHPDNWMAC
jgi:hypothetical protein